MPQCHSLTRSGGQVGDVAACAEALEPADAEPPSKKARTNGKDTAPSADAPRKAASCGASCGGWC